MKIREPRHFVYMDGANNELLSKLIRTPEFRGARFRNARLYGAGQTEVRTNWSEDLEKDVVTIVKDGLSPSDINRVASDHAHVGYDVRVVSSDEPTAAEPEPDPDPDPDPDPEPKAKPPQPPRTPVVK